MSDPQIVGATFLRETLITSVDIQAMVELEEVAGQYKIFWENVPDFIAMPYIVLSHIAGGFENTTQAEAVDEWIKVIGVTGDPVVAATFANKIAACLHRQLPTSTTYGLDNILGNDEYVPYSTVRLHLPILERKVAQNVPYFSAGGIYRIRLMKQ